jgi:hypothetical protein
MEEDEIGGEIAYIGKMRNTCKIVIRKSEGKRQLGKLSNG